MRVLLAALAALVTALVAPATTSAAVDRLRCTGYAQPRQFVDAQSWWTQMPGQTGTDFGHVHVGACIPERANLKYDARLDVRVILMDNPGEFQYWSLVLKGKDYEKTVRKSYAAGWTCPEGTCTKWWKVRLDISKFERAGLQEVRFRAFVDEPDGNRMTASLNWQTYVWNGKTRSDVTRRPYLRAKGWYTGAEYCEAALKSVPLPDKRVSSVWSPYLAMVWHGTEADLPVTYHTVRLDPDFHAGVQGTILREGVGEWEGSVRFDTAKHANGTHKLFARSDCDDPRDSTNSGVLVVNFKTAN